MALEVKKAKVSRRFADALEGFVNSAEKQELTLGELLEGVLLLIVKGQDRVITLLLIEIPELGKQVKKDLHNLRRQINAELKNIVVDGCNDDFALELTFNIIVNNVRQLAQKLRDAVEDKNSKPSEKQRGRERKYTDNELERMQNAYEKEYSESDNSRAAWNKVAESFGYKSGDAVRKACANYRRKKLEKKK